MKILIALLTFCKIQNYQYKPTKKEYKDVKIEDINYKDPNVPFLSRMNSTISIFVF